MDYRQFIDHVGYAIDLHPEWRRGQTYFNELYRINPELAEQVRGRKDVDPFYRDEVISSFLDFLHRYHEAFGSLVDERYLNA